MFLISNLENKSLLLWEYTIKKMNILIWLEVLIYIPIKINFFEIPKYKIPWENHILYDLKIANEIIFFYSQNCNWYSLYNCQNVKYTDVCDKLVIVTIYFLYGNHSFVMMVLLQIIDFKFFFYIFLEL